MHRSLRTWAMALGVGAALAGSTTVASSKPAAPPEAKGSAEIDPKAEQQLERMRQYLMSLKSFTVAADTTKDEVVHDDFKVQRAARARILVRMPDRFRAEVNGDDAQRLFVYDGHALSLETKKPNAAFFATVPAPATLRETLDAAMERHDVELPLADILYVATGGRVLDKVLAAGDLGPSQVGGVPCEHLAFRTKAVDWQVCIEHGDKPLPRKLVITSRDSRHALQSSAVLDWDLKTPITDEAFSFKASEGASRIDFAPKGKTKP